MKREDTRKDNPVSLSDLDRMCQGPSEMHARLFHAMHERNWYQTPVAGQQAIESEIVKWEQQQVRNPELRP